jgi:hypothetical protein
MCSNILTSKFLAELAREIAAQKKRGVVKRAGTFERVPQLLAVSTVGLAVEFATRHLCCP